MENLTTIRGYEVSKVNEFTFEVKLIGQSKSTFGTCLCNYELKVDWKNNAEMYWSTYPTNFTARQEIEKFIAKLA